MSRESLGGSSSVSGGLSWRPDHYLDSDPVNFHSATKTDPDTSISSSLPNTHVLDTCVTTPTLHVSHESSDAVTVSPRTGRAFHGTKKIGIFSNGKVVHNPKLNKKNNNHQDYTRTHSKNQFTNQKAILGYVHVTKQFATNHPLLNKRSLNLSTFSFMKYTTYPIF